MPAGVFVGKATVDNRMLGARSSKLSILKTAECLFVDSLETVFADAKAWQQSTFGGGGAVKLLLHFLAPLLGKKITRMLKHRLRASNLGPRSHAQSPLLENKGGCRSWRIRQSKVKRGKERLFGGMVFTPFHVGRENDQRLHCECLRWDDRDFCHGYCLCFPQESS